MDNRDRPSIEDDFKVAPAHPAPAQSPRALDDDELTRHDDLEREGGEPDQAPQKPDGREPI